MNKKINLQKILEEIKEDEGIEGLKPKQWASQKDIKKLLQKKKTQKEQDKT